MKKKYLTIVLLFSFFLKNVFAQTTYVPDDNFEQYLINQGYDDVLDDYVLTANISGITQLTISDKKITGRPISL